MINVKRAAAVAEMLRSDNEQERATAAARLTDMLQEAGMTWTDVITKALAQEQRKQDWKQERASNAGQQAYEAQRQQQQAAEGFWASWTTQAQAEAEMRRRKAAEEALRQRQYQPKTSQRTRKHCGVDGAQLVAYLMTKLGDSRLTAWDQEFIQGCSRQSKPLYVGFTERQWEVLMRIGRRLNVVGDEAA